MTGTGLKMQPTVPTLNFCIKCPGMIHDHSPDFLGMEDLTTERSFDSQATWVIDVLGLLF